MLLETTHRGRAPDVTGKSGASAIKDTLTGGHTSPGALVGTPTIKLPRYSAVVGDTTVLRDPV
jgi:hypothetical protein